MKQRTMGIGLQCCNLSFPPTRLLDGVNDLVKDHQTETNLDEVEKDLNTKKVLALFPTWQPSLSFTATNQKLRYSLVCSASWSCARL